MAIRVKKTVEKGQIRMEFESDNPVDMQRVQVESKKSIFRKHKKVKKIYSGKEYKSIPGGAPKKPANLNRYQKFMYWLHEKVLFKPLKNITQFFMNIMSNNKYLQFNFDRWRVALYHFNTGIGFKVIRFLSFHQGFKCGIIYPIFNWISKKVSKYLVKELDDIDEGWHNNINRMWYWSMRQGLWDLWYHFKYDVKSYPKHSKLRVKKFGSFDNFVKHYKVKKKWTSHKSRMMGLNIILTEIMEDTVDREWFNFGLLRFWHEMNDFYKDKGGVPKPGEFPIYDVKTENYPEYFVCNMNHPVWKPNQEKERYNENGK